jgi:hypothetical protein
VVSIVPVAVLPPTTPLTLQLSVIVVGEAVNCCADPARTLAALGEIVSVSGAGGPGSVNPVGDNAQLEVINIKTTTNGASVKERRTMPPRPTSTRNFQLIGGNPCKAGYQAGVFR